MKTSEGVSNGGKRGDQVWHREVAQAKNKRTRFGSPMVFD